MNVKTFQAGSIAEAVAKVKQELGAAAVILHTRSFKRGGVMGVGAKTIVEITAGANVNVQPRKRPAALARAKTSGAGGDSGAYESPSGNSATAVAERHPLRTAYNISPPAPRAREVRPPAPSQESRLESTVNPATRELAASVLKEPAFELRNEISSLRTMVESLLQRTAAGMAVGGRGGPGARRELPEHLSALYTQLIQQQVSDEIAARVVDDVRAELTPERLGNSTLVRERLIQKLEQMLPASLSSPVARPTTGNGGSGPGGAGGKCRSICLIGPTGVGKTTTIAKLAATFKLRQRQKVGLITIDTYRIAAVDQLRTYANIIGVPLKVVLTPSELLAAMKEMSDYDVILIDTAGRSHMDQLKLNELAQFIAIGKPTEVHLVLSSTTTQEAMEAAIEKFSALRPGIEGDQIIFTKLDEAVSFGILLNVARTAGRALSYITTGQDVPDNIEVGQPRRLAKLILGDKL